MANLGNYKTPTGQTGNIFSIKDWVGLILGGIVLLVSFSTSQNVAKAISSRVGAIDSTPAYPFEKENQASQAPKRQVW